MHVSPLQWTFVTILCTPERPTASRSFFCPLEALLASLLLHQSEQTYINRERGSSVTVARMDPFSGSGSWNMMPSIPSHNSSPAASNQDNLFLSPQHQQQFYQQPTQFPQQQFQQQGRTPQQQQNQHHQSLASNFHLLHVGLLIFFSFLLKLFLILVCEKINFC